MASYIANAHSKCIPYCKHKGVLSANVAVGAVFAEILYHLYCMYVSVQVINRYVSVFCHVEYFS